MEEERRLCYVGITRAKRRVYLVYAFRRSFMGSSNVNQRSRFLEDIPKHLTTTPDWSVGENDKMTGALSDWSRVRMDNSKAVEKEPSVPTAELKDGDRVRHGVFGEGVVVAMKKSKADIEATVVFEKVGLKRLLLSFARLEKIE
jgi:DNA helicase-2/ATP-dependent DNA helicase PcrA